MKCGRVSVVLSLVLAASLIGCVSAGKYRELQEKYDRDMADMQATNDNLKRRAGDLEKSGAITVRELQIERMENERLRAELEKKLAGIPGIEFTDSGAIRMEGDYFFDSGMASLRKDARGSLDKLASVLAEHLGRILVVGHTDSDPIEKSKKMWTTGLNLELGANRAVQVAAYLVGKGIPADKFEVRSPGEFQNIAPNDTKENKKKNRRVEIFLVAPPGK
ncbi:MAG: OmpA family protein [Planctomycetota bacterium]|nr:OmpA family protein [Planctomycetota bacterium]